MYEKTNVNQMSCHCQAVHIALSITRGHIIIQIDRKHYQKQSEQVPSIQKNNF